MSGLAVRTFLGVVRHELALLRHNEFLALVALYPVVVAVVLQLVIGAGQRPDLGAFAVVGPWLVGVWQLANFVAGETMNIERYRATLEPMVAAPASTTGVLLAKIAAVSGLSLFGLLEALVVAALFGRPATVHHPWLLATSGALTLVAATTTSLVLVGLYVSSRSARTYQNSVSYPVLVLGGAVVPVTLLPEAVQPLSRLVFLSWAGDLLRASLAPADPEGALAAPIVMALFDVEVDLADVPALLGLLLATIASTAGLAAVVGAVLLHRTKWRNLGSNTVTFTIMVCCGVNVPLDATPAALAAIGQVLPGTHGLFAIRAVLDGAGGVAPLLLRELATGAAWFALSLPLYAFLVRRGRQLGTLEQA